MRLCIGKENVMRTVTVDFSLSNGPVKPMHATNNGPVYKYDPDQRVTNLTAWQEAGIPYARTHDASIDYTYGGEHVVDVHGIFKNFDSDPYDPKSYDFCITDEYIRVIEMGGSKVFYRLGSKIEHWQKKYGTLPPKDFHKWAVICEHIIRHYTEGWGNGFYHDIVYWEIWNEPDLDSDDSTHKRCWGGTKQQFFEFYNIAAKHLKSCFPHLKIGGPAIAGDLDWSRDFLIQLQAPLDFFSWHIYTTDPYKIEEKAKAVRLMLDELGFTETESILNEWNYVIAFDGDEWVTSAKTIKSLKGAAFNAASMCLCQNAPVYMLMYYDARPSVLNGMFDTDFTNECLKGYYPFKMFNELYTLDYSVKASSDNKEVFVSASRGKNKAAVLLSSFAPCSPSDSLLKVTFLNFPTLGEANRGAKLQFFLLDNSHDMALVREEIFFSHSFSSIIPLTPFASYLIRLEAIND